MMDKIRAKYGRYYDLIRVPHGHIPAPKINLWSNFPMPIKEYRANDFYECPSCGEPSFFKIEYACYECQGEDTEDADNWAWKRYKRNKRRNYFRDLKKRLEYLFLPFLVLLGKAWYVRSERLHNSDLEYQERERLFEEWWRNEGQNENYWEELEGEAIENDEEEEDSKCMRL